MGKPLGIVVILASRLLTTLSVTMSAALPAQVLGTPSVPVPESYFGLHIHRADTSTPWPALPFGSWRLWDAYVAWPNIEPKRGVWDFSRLDRYVAMANAKGVEVLLPLGLSPPWASARPTEPSSYGPGNAAEPADMGAWRDYVRIVAQRYKGRIHYYELWNEVNSKPFYSGSSEKLVELASIAYETLKEVDPEAIVVSPSVTGDGRNLNWLDDYLAKGGGQYADVISYHFYVANDAPEAVVSLIRKVQAIMRKHGQDHKPLWNTETGWRIANTDGTVEDASINPDWKRLAPEEAAAYVARALIIGNWAGVGRFYWYAWDNRWLGLVEPNSQKIKPAGQAFDTVRDWLVWNTIRDCAQAGSIWSCMVVDQKGKTTWLVWSVGAGKTWATPAGWFAESVEGLDRKIDIPVDTRHIPISESPVRVVVRRR